MAEVEISEEKYKKDSNTGEVIYPLDNGRGLGMRYAPTGDIMANGEEIVVRELSAREIRKYKEGI